MILPFHFPSLTHPWTVVCPHKFLWCCFFIYYFFAWPLGDDEASWGHIRLSNFTQIVIFLIEWTSTHIPIHANTEKLYFHRLPIFFSLKFLRSDDMMKGTKLFTVEHTTMLECWTIFFKVKEKKLLYMPTTEFFKTRVCWG